MKHLFILFLLTSVLIGCGSSNESSSDTSLINDAVNKLGSNPPDCSMDSSGINQNALLSSRCNWLSNYNLFIQLSHEIHMPNEGLISYELNSSLFTDFLDKSRFLFIPENSSADYSTLDHFQFPIGTTAVKIFSENTPEDGEIIEIRLAIKRSTGWIFVPYIWSSEHQDAFLYKEGLSVEITTYNDRIKHTTNHEIPSASTCTLCHQNEFSVDDILYAPIGLKARHLNKDITHQGNLINQLKLWENNNLLVNLPEDLTLIDTAPDWRDEQQNIQDRAKAYLDINCAHCHSEAGAGSRSGLRLEYWRKDIGHSHGVCNSSHGWRGGGFDIWPGWGEISSIPIRMRHTTPTDQMPPIGRSLVDEDAAQLISDWIDTLPYQSCAE